MVENGQGKEEIYSTTTWYYAYTGQFQKKRVNVYTWTFSYESFSYERLYVNVFTDLTVF